MNVDQRNSLLMALSNRQERCAPVTIQIGFVSQGGTVKNDGLLILDAPPAIVETVQGWVYDENSRMSALEPRPLPIEIHVAQGGLLIR